MLYYEVQGIGNFRGSPRFYKQGRKIASMGFTVGSQYATEVHEEEGLVIFRLSEQGDRKVSKKMSCSQEVPVIDVNNANDLGIFEGMDQIRVVLEKGVITLMGIATEVRRRERIQRLKTKLEAGEAITVGSTSHGAGIMSNAVHSGLGLAGVKARLGFANDIDASYLEQSELNNPIWDKNTISISGPLQEVAFDDFALSKLPLVELIEAGLPCVAASVAGRAKKKLAMPEDDEHCGHLIVGFISLIAKTNPVAVLLENVKQYLNTASYAVYRNQMRDFGYVVQEVILEGREFGGLENRNRMVSIAMTRGIAFDFQLVELPEVASRKIVDVLDKVELDSPLWSEMKYLKAKEISDGLSGKCFKRQEVSQEDTSVGTLTRGYNKRRSTDPMLIHPLDKNLLRLFTVAEHARIKNVPCELLNGAKAARGHEMLGQSVDYNMVMSVGKAIGKSMMNWLGMGDQPRETKYSLQHRLFA